MTRTKTELTSFYETEVSKCSLLTGKRDCNKDSLLRHKLSNILQLVQLTKFTNN